MVTLPTTTMGFGVVVNVATCSFERILKMVIISPAFPRGLKPRSLDSFMYGLKPVPFG
jgi:hypothetical protein